MFRLCGYHPPLWRPTEKDFRKVLAGVREKWLDRWMPPAILADVYLTIWYANAAFARVFTLERRPKEIANHHILEVLLDPHFGAQKALRRFLDEGATATLISVAIARFRARGADSEDDAWYGQIVQRLRGLPGFEARWRAQEANTSQLLGEVGMVHALPLHGGGDLVAHAMLARRDPRFAIVLFLPTDSKTSGIIESLVR